MPEDFVTCPYCGERLKTIHHKHLSKHDKTIDDLKDEFPGWKTKPDFVIEQLKSDKKAKENTTKIVKCMYCNADIEVNINCSNSGNACYECKSKGLLSLNQARAKERAEKGQLNPSHDPSVVEKRRQRWLQKTEEERRIIAEKRKETVLKRFGVPVAMMNEEVAKKSREKRLENLDRKEFAKKYRNSYIKKFIPKLMQKLESLELELIDKEFLGASAKHQFKCKKCGTTFVKSWRAIHLGYKCEVCHPRQKTKSKEFKEKMKQLWKDPNSKWNKEEYRNKLRERAQNYFLPSIYKQLEYLNLELADEKYVNAHTRHNFKCKKCGTAFAQTWNSIQQGYLCPTCYPRNQGYTSGEKEVANYVESLGFQVITRDRSTIPPFEIDIFIPSASVAIEYCGLYFHSEEKKPKVYHYNKLKRCEEKGIRLITLFEDEWMFKRDIVCSRIRQILNKQETLERASGRECTIRPIDTKTKNEFLEKFHLQGSDISLVRLGALYKDRLVAVMTFSKGSVAKGTTAQEGIWELSRFCSDYNYRTPGVASKLLTYFKENYSWREIYSYADLRWFTGNLYTDLGFETDGKPRLNYWYVKGYQRVHRFNLRKKPGEPADIPERVLRVNEGYQIIWDCGNLKFVLKNKDLQVDKQE